MQSTVCTPGYIDLLIFQKVGSGGLRDPEISPGSPITKSRIKEFLEVLKIYMMIDNNIARCLSKKKKSNKSEKDIVNVYLLYNFSASSL